MKANKVSLQFLGAAGTVTGSRTLLKVNGRKYLVDCGMFQGPKEIRIRNWEEFPGASDIEAIFLTHAHVDHSGYLPKMVKEGFKGPIICSQGTADLLQIILRDAAYLQEEDARFANEVRHSKHFPAIPLFNLADAEQALSQIRVVAKNSWEKFDDLISLRLMRSGHILGSTFVQLQWDNGNGGRVITFSGDIGNGRSNIIKDPVAIAESDFLVLESTYGDRVQPKVDHLTVLEGIINRVWEREGVLVIPAFSVGRTQEIIYLVNQLESQGRIPKIPVWLDSPMAQDATDIYMSHRDELKDVILKDQVRPPLCPQDYQIVKSADDSMLRCMSDEPGIVISAAGMLTGGRVLHHLKARLPFQRNAVLFVGYQVEGTKGRLLKQGLTTVTIHHKKIDVEAEVLAVESLSAHGDSDDIMKWCQGFERPPQMTFLNHGEPGALGSLCYRLKTELGWNAQVAEDGKEYILDQE